MIGAQETVRVRYDKNQPTVDAERKGQRPRRKQPDVHKPHRIPNSHQGRRLETAKREERERRQAQIRIRRTIVALMVLLALAGCVWGTVALTGSDAFRATDIAVEGVSHLQPPQVVALARIPADASLFGLDRKGIERRIAESPWVAAVKVTRDFPHGVVIAVTERVACAAVDVGTERLWVVSEDGYWLGERGVEESSAVVIRDLEDVTPEPGRRIRSRVLLNAVRIASHLSPEMLARTRVLSAPSIEKTALVTNDGIQIYIGEADEVEKKEQIARAILKKEKGRVVYINVRVVDSPTWRGLSE